MSDENELMDDEYDFYAELAQHAVQHLIADRCSDTRLEIVADHMRRDNRGAYAAGIGDQAAAPPLTLADLHAAAREQVQALLDGRHSDSRWLALLALLVDLDEAGRRADAEWLRHPALLATFDRVLLAQDAPAG